MWQVEKRKASLCCETVQFTHWPVTRQEQQMCVCFTESEGGLEKLLPWKVCRSEDRTPFVSATSLQECHELYVGVVRRFFSYVSRLMDPIWTQGRRNKNISACTVKTRTSGRKNWFHTLLWLKLHSNCRRENHRQCFTFRPETLLFTSGAGCQVIFHFIWDHNLFTYRKSCN